MEIALDKEQVAKEAAARYAAGLVEDGMVVGLGTGSTATPFVRALGQRVREGLRLTGVPTSEATARLARVEGIDLTTLEEHPHLDIAVDGADAVDPALNLLKGLGGALLREKIVAHASVRFLVMVHEAKLVNALTETPLVPVEVVPFGWSQTQHELEGLGATVTRREVSNGQRVPFITDSGHYVLHCRFADLSDALSLAVQIKALIGVVEHGLFIGMADEVIVGEANGNVRVLTALHGIEAQQ